jgi:hypothetical protein
MGSISDGEKHVGGKLRCPSIVVVMVMVKNKTHNSTERGATR